MSAKLTDAMTALDVVRSFFRAYNAHEVDRMLSLCSDDAQIRYVPMGMLGQGPAREVGKKIWSGLIDSFPSLSVRAESIFGDGQGLVSDRTTSVLTPIHSALPAWVRCRQAEAQPGRRKTRERSLGSLKPSESFFVLKYNTNTSARSMFNAPDICGYGFGVRCQKASQGVCLLPIDELCSAGHQLSSGQAIPRFGVISRCPRNLPSLEEWVRL
jgi:hypothetical protein